MKRSQCGTYALLRHAEGVGGVELGMTLPMLLIVSFLTVIFNVGELRCQEKADRIQATHQTELIDKNNIDENEADLKEDKHMRFKMLVWMIRSNLINKYQKLDTEELEDKFE
jgi:hypothetical protein